MRKKSKVINFQSEKQMSKAFITIIFLALSGGFQDAYTYITRDEVFSNAQTGNIVLMSQHFIQGEWLTGARYLLPLLSFAAGIFVAERVRNRLKNYNKLHWRQAIVLAEIIILLIVGLIPNEFNMIATMLVSFSCAMQVLAFSKANGYSYASTMCIGNLRSGTEALSLYLREKDKKYKKKVVYYYSVILIFAIGAGFGAVMSKQLGIRTIWISCVLLLASFILMFIKEKKNNVNEREIL